MQKLTEMINQFYSKATSILSLPDIALSWVEIVEIIIISFLIYHMLLWVKSTRAWNLFKGIVVIMLFVLVAALLQMNTILWLARNMLSVGLVALVIIFQPDAQHIPGQP